MVINTHTERQIRRDKTPNYLPVSIAQIWILSGEKNNYGKIKYLSKPAGIRDFHSKIPHSSKDLWLRCGKVNQIWSTHCSHMACQTLKMERHLFGSLMEMHNLGQIAERKTGPVLADMKPNDVSHDIWLNPG